MKFIFKLIFVIIALFITFIVEEAFRLKVEPKAKPLIIMDKTKYCVECIKPDEILEAEYVSIGYKVRATYKLEEKTKDNLKSIKVIKKEFLLFNKYKLWGWSR